MSQDEIKEMVTPSIEEKKKKKLKTMIQLMACVCMIMMAGMVIGLGKFYFDNLRLAKNLTESESKVVELKTKNDDLYSKWANASDIAKISKSEAAAMKRQITKIKTNDDLMIRDIELYIKARYRRVPTIVAQSLALIIVSICKEENVSPELLMGIIEIESQFNPMARNDKSGAIGAMQIMPEWSKKLGLKSVYELYNIPTNIKSGVKVLKIHINEDAKGDIAKGLYFYVGKDSSYANKVFQAAGKFVVFRSTIDDDDHTVSNDQPTNGNEEKKLKPITDPKDTGE